MAAEGTVKGVSPPTAAGSARTMEPLRKTPTEPLDYLTLSAGYGALLGALLVAIRDGGDEPVRPAEIVPLGTATFALAKLISREKVGTSVRQPFLDESATGDRHPKGRRLRFAVGELLSCPRCVGAWASLGVVALRVVRPREARVVTAVLGASAVNDWLHAGFSLLCAQANKSEAAAAPSKAETTAPTGSAAAAATAPGG